QPENKYLKVVLEGTGMNRFGIGTKVTLHYNNTIAYQEAMPMRGFESTVDNRLNFGLGKTTQIDSVVVQWPGGNQQVLRNVKPNQTIVLKQTASTPPPPANIVLPPTLLTESKDNYGIDFIHKENEFVDFDRDRLI